MKLYDGNWWQPYLDFNFPRKNREPHLLNESHENKRAQLSYYFSGKPYKIMYNLTLVNNLNESQSNTWVSKI